MAAMSHRAIIAAGTASATPALLDRVGASRFPAVARIAAGGVGAWYFRNRSGPVGAVALGLSVGVAADALLDMVGA